MPSLPRLTVACLLFAAAPAWAQSHAAHAPADASQATPPAPGERIEVALDASAWRDLPPVAVRFTAHEKTSQCQGVSLAALLRKAQAMPAELRGRDLAKVVLVTARDGYRVSFSLAELDPALGNASVVLAHQCDGKPLDEKEGPLRLVVPEDGRKARSIRQIEHLYVVNP